MTELSLCKNYLSDDAKDLFIASAIVNVETDPSSSFSRIQKIDFSGNVSEESEFGFLLKNAMKIERCFINLLEIRVQGIFSGRGEYSPGDVIGKMENQVPEKLDQAFHRVKIIL